MGAVTFLGHTVQQLGRPPSVHVMHTAPAVSN